MPEMPISVPDELHRFYAHLQRMEVNVGVLQKDVASGIQSLLECKTMLAGLSANLKVLRSRIDEAVVGHEALEVCAAQLEKHGKLDIMRSTLLKRVTKDLPAQTPATTSTASTGTRIASEHGQRKRPRSQGEYRLALILPCLILHSLLTVYLLLLTNPSHFFPGEPSTETGSYHLGG
ncbi:hypothetical protein BDN72DRAFT_905179 [Pluteus cervinus]|uniref:Uncharacterized protein n=1 Tax=Pluteus cervinus TaxID=181527 RepID=A0ACD3A2Z9_9AGAR|nr:hypothetical protein BDN72DRAFT_905179 [Pluteus cervinus]